MSDAEVALDHLETAESHRHGASKSLNDLYRAPLAFDLEQLQALHEAIATINEAQLLDTGIVSDIEVLIEQEGEAGEA